MTLEDLPDIRHPFAKYTLAEAVNFAVMNAQTFGHEVPETLEAVRTYINEINTRCGHTWLTGAAALDVLDAAIDGKDLRENCRLR